MAGLAIAGIPALIGRNPSNVFSRPGEILAAKSLAYQGVANAQANLANSVIGNGDPNQSILAMFQASALIGLLSVFFKSAIERTKEFIKSLSSMTDLITGSD